MFLINTMKIDEDSVTKYLNEFETSCLTEKFNNYDVSVTNDILQHFSNIDILQYLIESFVSHDPERILNKDLKYFGVNFNRTFNPYDHDAKEAFTFTEIHANLSDKLIIYLKQLIKLFIGVAALQKFVEANICGPKISDCKEYTIFSTILPDKTFSTDAAFQFLKRNGELPLSVIVHPKLLCLSKIFLSSVKNDDDLTVSRRWWLARCQMIHQLLIPERIASLHDEMLSLFRQTVDLDWMKKKINSSIKVLLKIEYAQMHLYYHEVTAAQTLIKSAQELVGLNIELSGAYGKRTQFQQKAVAQLYVKLDRSDGDGVESSVSTDDLVHFPVDLHLQDDTLLNKVSFVDGDDKNIPSLLSEEQLVLLAHCCKVLRGEAFDELLKEEVSAYVNCLLEQPRVWAIYLKALVMRCRLEKKSSRRVERSLMQLEAVLDSIKKDGVLFSMRVPMLFATAFPLVWSLERELADLWMSLGGTKSALAIYERLNSWQDMVVCYKILDRTSCAEALIRDKLKQEETPLLWCLLGDVTDDPDMYLKAYDISGGTNARSQRSLAYYHYKRKDFEQSVRFFERSLEINPLQMEVWFSLGYAALQTERYDLAIKAYRRVVDLDQDNFEAWNNLANAHIKCQQKVRAWRCLSEALKCNYEEWRVWENFLVVSVDVGAFEDVLRSWHRLLDLKGKYSDAEVLRILVRAINEDLMDASGQPASRLRKSALQFLGRLSSSISSDYVVWDCYSSLQCPNVAEESDMDVLQRAIQHQQKAVRCCAQKVDDMKNYDVCKDVLTVTQRFANLSLVVLAKADESSKVQQKSSSKLTIQAVIMRAEKILEEFHSEQRDELVQILNELKNSWDCIVKI